MDHIQGQGRRSFTAVLLGGLALTWLVSGKKQSTAPASKVPQPDLQKPKQK